MDVQDIEKVSSLFKRRRKFHYVQIGVSSRCFLNCAMCPHTCFLDHWNSWKMERLRAKVQGVSCGIRSKRRFPQEEYGEVVEEAFINLTSRRVRLRGGR